MPLPRFDRLPEARRAELLRVAREHFAEHGPAAASYNKIIESAGISKTAAYHYFDGREDLLAAVLDDVLARLADTLGPWQPASAPAEFWARLREGSDRLRTQLTERPDDLALLDAALTRADNTFQTWLTDVVANGRAIGVIRTDIDEPLQLAATAAVFRVLDTWTFGDDADPAQAWRLLAGLWGTEPADAE